DLPMNFSQRMGLEPAVKPFQTESMDRALRNALWNAFEMTFLERMKQEWSHGYLESATAPNNLILKPIWMKVFKESLSTLPTVAVAAVETVHNWYFDESHAPWNKVYDFIECLGNLQGVPAYGLSGAFRKVCNGMLEQEFSGY